MSLIAFQDHDAIAVGRPLPFSVYGADRKLLLAKGLPVASERMRETLLAQARYIISSEAPGDSKRSVSATDDAVAEKMPVANADADEVASIAPVDPNLTGTLEGLFHQYADFEKRSRFGMRIARDERGDSFPAIVIGVVHDKRYLILTAPTTKANALVPVVKGEVWLCRLFNATTVFRFSGRVLKVAHEPIPYIHVELPKSVERRMVRKQPRALSSLAATLHRSDGDAAVIVDISVSGVRLAVPANVQLQKNAVIPLFMNISMLDRLFQLKVTAKIIATFGEGDPQYPDVHFYGAQFEDLTDSAMLVLHGYVQAQLAEELDRLSGVLDIESTSTGTPEAATP